MQATIPETHKKPGIHYALTQDGIELPIIDVTHQAFAIRIGESELDAQVQNCIRSTQQQARPGCDRLAGDDRAGYRREHAGGNFLAGMFAFRTPTLPSRWDEVGKLLSRGFQRKPVMILLQVPVPGGAGNNP